MTLTLELVLKGKIREPWLNHIIKREEDIQGY